MGGGYREEFAAIVEQHDTVAEETPPLLRMAGHGPCRTVIWRQRIRTSGLVLARLVPW
jgi:hypothetical protein